MIRNRIVTDNMKSTMHEYLCRYINDFQVFPCDANLATVLSMLYETSLVEATPVGMVASVSYLRLNAETKHCLAALSEIYTTDVCNTVDPRKSVINLLRRMGKHEFTLICGLNKMLDESLWNSIVEFCSTDSRVKRPEELQQGLLKILQENNIKEMYVAHGCNVLDNLSCPEIYLVADGDATLAVRQITDLYEYSDTRGTYLYASVMQYDKSESMDYFMSTAQVVYKDQKWLL